MSADRINGLRNDPDETNPFDLMWPEYSAPLRQKGWTLEAVYQYRESLVKLGLDPMVIEDIIERDAGSEFCMRPYLSRRQAC